MLENIECVDGCRFFSDSLGEHQFFAVRGLARIPGNLRKLFPYGVEWV